MDKVSAEVLSKYTKSQEKPGEGIDLKKEQKADVTIQTEGEPSKPTDN